MPTSLSKPRPRFHTSTPLAPSLVGTTIALPEDVAHHAVRVLRLAQGDAITLFDGNGGEYAATLDETGKRATLATVDRFENVDRESPLAVTLVQGVIAADAMDYAVRKAVELGAAAVTPVLCVRSQAGLQGQRGEKRLAHWRAIAIAACEQCGRNRIPAIAPVQTLHAWLDGAPFGRAVIAAPGARRSLAAYAAEGAPAIIVVGPEGGFTDAERDGAIEKGIVPVSLGPRVLRAETAGVAALAMIAAVCGDAR